MTAGDGIFRHADIIVRDCRMAAGHGGVVIGSEISGGYSNLFVENCEMDSPELLRVIRIKTSECRGGIIENINVRNVKVGICSEAVLHITLNYEPNEPCIRDFPPVVRNVTLENVTSNKSKYGIYIEGLDKTVNVSDITLKNCAFNGVEQGTSDHRCGTCEAEESIYQRKEDQALRYH